MSGIAVDGLEAHVDDRVLREVDAVGNHELAGVALEQAEADESVDLGRARGVADGARG